MKFNKNINMAVDFKLAGHCTAEFLKGKVYVSSYLTWSHQRAWHILYNHRFLKKLMYAKFKDDPNVFKTENWKLNFILQSKIILLSFFSCVFFSLCNQKSTETWSFLSWIIWTVHIFGYIHLLPFGVIFSCLTLSSVQLSSRSTPM